MTKRELGQWKLKEESEDTIVLAEGENRIDINRDNGEKGGNQVWYVDGSFAQSDPKSWRLTVEDKEELWSEIQDLLHSSDI